jgi:hypothetical protein
VSLPPELDLGGTDDDDVAVVASTTTTKTTTTTSRKTDADADADADSRYLLSISLLAPKQPDRMVLKWSKAEDCGVERRRRVNEICNVVCVWCLYHVIMNIPIK